MFLAFLGWYWEGSSTPVPPDPPAGGAVPTGGWDYGWVPAPRRLVAERLAMRVNRQASYDALALLILQREQEAARVRRNKAVAALLLAAV